MDEPMGRSVDGFEFIDIENGSIAREEVQRINYISSKMSDDNPAAVLSVYNKMLDSNTFLTPVGIEYLRRIQNYLYKNAEIDDAKIRDIPIIVSYADIKQKQDDDKNRERAEKQKHRKVKTFKKEYKTSLMVNLLLVLVIIAMFIIVLKSDTPNMINYKNAITNEYASWEQELSEREAAVREKEAELLDK